MGDMTSSPRFSVLKDQNKKTLPNLIIIGAQKCATTSLHYYLNLHPHVSMSREKELNFFISERNWHEGIEWYKSHFTGKASVLGESSPDYTHHPFFKRVSERMHSVVPDAKLIYILRDPIERIISQYIHEYARREEDRKISEVFTSLESNPYICRSQYYMQLEQYTKYYPKSNILIITTEDLNHSRRKTLKEIFNFLNVDDSFYSYKFLSTWHKSDYKRRSTRTGMRMKQMPMMRIIELFPFEMRGGIEKLIYLPFSDKVKRPILNEGVRQAIMAVLSDDMNRLRAYTGRDFEGWCV